MNSAPDDPVLIDRLAAEYVLGTLRGPARRRFERWRSTSRLVDEHCVAWEERLLPMLRELRPLPPPAHVWQQIRRRLNLSVPARRGTLRTLALAASVLLVVVLGTFWYWRTLGPGHLAQVATISESSGALLWRVDIYGKPGEVRRLSVRASGLATRPAGRDYELWALPKGGAPVSLGVLPYVQASAQLALSAAQQQALKRAAQLAVSLEPVGGSPTGQPTGAIVYVVPLHTTG
jgi:anti-sigma-K factor RskA